MEKVAKFPFLLEIWLSSFNYPPFSSIIYKFQGKFRYESGAIYEGDYINGKKHGTGITKPFFLINYWQGKLLNPDGSYYQGEYKNDKKDGKGRFNI